MIFRTYLVVFLSVFWGLLACDRISAKFSRGGGNSAGKTSHGNGEGILSQEDDAKGNDEVNTDDGSAAESSSSQATLSNRSVVWKRYRALESGLMSALRLSKSELCLELGRFSCVDKVHLYPLGGNEPFEASQYTNSEDPTVLTPIALDRLVLSACIARIALDKQSGLGQAVVFKFFPLNEQPVPAAKVKDQVVELYRRFLARDPLDDEIAVIAKFADQEKRSEVFAKSICYAIGSSVENLFY